VNSTELVERLRDELSVLIVPGDHFGIDHCLRISFGLQHDYLKSGLERISAGIRAQEPVSRETG
jgi:aspartate/methionine/tyrosine aminotransferase